MAKLTAKQERDIVDNFLHKLGAKAKITSRQMRRIEPYSYRPFNSNTVEDYYSQHLTTYVEDVVEMEIPLSKFKELAENSYDIDELRAKYGPNIDDMGMAIMREDFVQRNEAAIRRTNPGVQKAWERYQTMLKIAGG